MDKPTEKINNLNDKLVELCGQWIKIECNLDTLDEENVEAQSVDTPNQEKSPESRPVPVSKRTDK